MTTPIYNRSKVACREPTRWKLKQSGYYTRDKLQKLKPISTMKYGSTRTPSQMV